MSCLAHAQKTITPLAYKNKPREAFVQTDPLENTLISDSLKNTIISDFLAHNNRKNYDPILDSALNKNALIDKGLHFNPLQKRNLNVSSAFGSRIHPITFKHHFHNGVDIKCYYDPLYAVISGHVTVGENNRSGKYLVIKNPITNISVSYAHLSVVLLESGQFVEVGQGVGISGNSGSSTGPHLHFTLRIDGEYINPLPYIIH